SISSKTSKKSKAQAEKMGYQPDTLAAARRNNTSNTLAIPISRSHRHFISPLISCIDETARQAGFNVIISQRDDKYEHELRNLKALYDSRISGLIVSLSMQTVNMDHFKPFINQGIPLVFVDRVPQGFNTYKVVIDNYSDGYNATKHLIDKGCKRIAHFAGAQHRNVYEERKKGYLDALKEHQI